MPAEVSFWITNLGTVVVKHGGEDPESHECNLPDEATVGTVAVCEDCGEYWRCFGYPTTGPATIPCLPNAQPSASFARWEKVGPICMLYIAWWNK